MLKHKFLTTIKVYRGVKYRKPKTERDSNSHIHTKITNTNTLTHTQRHQMKNTGGCQCEYNYTSGSEAHPLYLTPMASGCSDRQEYSISSAFFQHLHQPSRSHKSTELLVMKSSEMTLTIKKRKSVIRRE